MENNKGTLDYPIKNYGTKYVKLLAIAKQSKELSVPVTHDSEILAEVIYAAREEMVNHDK